MNPFTNAKIVGSGIDPDAYHRQNAHRGEKDYVMTRSELMEFATCPRRWLAGYRSKDTESTEWGSLVDCMLLDQGRFDTKYAISPANYYDEESGKDKPWTFSANICKAWKKAQGDRTIAKAETFREARMAIERLLDYDDVRELIDCSAKQVLIVGEYRDRDTGLVIPVKCLLDFCPARTSKKFGQCLGDFKTARSANPLGWGKVVNNSGYDEQAAFYSDLHLAATGEERTDWIHLIQENVFPYEVLTPMPILSSEFIELGRGKYINALRRYAHALATGQWPSYPPTRTVFNGFQIIEPEIWMMKNFNGDLPEIFEIKPITAKVAGLTAPEFQDVPS